MLPPRFLAIAVAATCLTSGAMVGPAVAQQARQTAQGGDAASSYTWHVKSTRSRDEFRGLAAVSRDVAWVSGETGTVLRTTNRGASWRDVSPPAAAGRALRDIEAFGTQQAVTLSIGKGRQSRIFSTSDGGQTWTEVFRNVDPGAFYDCMAFSHDGIGLALSDPVDGYFRLARSTNFGKTWHVESTHGMPPALANEFAFAASGTCIISGPGHRFWFATGGTHPRVFTSADGGLHWSVTRTPMRGGAAAGIYSIAFRNPHHGVVVGGDYTDETNGARAAAHTVDGGRSWKLSARQVGGYRSGVSFLPSGRSVVAVGPTGSDVSTDGGRTWSGFDTARYDGVHCAPDGACWASGTEGRVAVLAYPR